MPISALFVSLALVMQAKDHGPLDLYEEYDRITGWGTTGINLGPIATVNREKVSLKLVISYEGESRPEKPSVWIGFVTAGRNWKYIDSRDIYFLVDGVRFKGTPHYDGKMVTNGVTEVVQSEMGFADFTKLANAAIVEGKVGPTEFRLTANQLLAAKAFLAVLSQPGIPLERIKREALERDAAEKAARIAEETPKAEKLLKEAKSLDRANKAVKALEIYRMIAQDYPDTEAGKQAAARAKVMTKAKSKR